jgi:hypothetical protein
VRCGVQEADCESYALLGLLISGWVLEALVRTKTTTEMLRVAQHDGTLRLK